MNHILTEYVNQLYRTTACKEEYINPIAYGMLSWRSISYCALGPYTGLEKWKQ
jgi:hypothetical protein